MDLSTCSVFFEVNAIALGIIVLSYLRGITYKGIWVIFMFLICPYKVHFTKPIFWCRKIYFLQHLNSRFFCRHIFLKVGLVWTIWTWLVLSKKLKCKWICIHQYNLSVGLGSGAVRSPVSRFIFVVIFSVKLPVLVLSSYFP